MAILIDDFKKVLIEGLKLEDITTDDIDNNSSLFGEDGLGLDSVDSIELVLIIEKEYGVKISNSADYKTIFSSVHSLFNHINENIK
ncbi:acyl carrier protein [Aliarcobacter trophiarum LMG 25534]|uniref:Acyl carrier protein n=1 Tax=Aliarcobacter trophiarum LMG 25534 TaxID=1032241 RepID=A0AAD0QJU1_9BACT|nr:phosphopantetheine-binding protein [Aliarcobacter trophiarum]AXK49064.1 acyl carrier protein [Aliarcobacter trophiarum LMG 25534]RXI28242.1 acyl carrier protein [Aliarcobacter trophiarum]RXJ90953.1 acyl carrier protein [Aliarcobacter trophiarum LMG 25534]